MSNWWDIDFSVTGPEPRTEELKTALPDLMFDDGARLFHHVEIVRSIPGFVIIHACRNYHGAEAVCELVARFRGLAFQGSLHSDNGYEQYTLFESRGGEATFQDMVIPNFEARFPRRPDRAEVEEQITELSAKIARLEFERKELNESLAGLGPTANCA